jgi:hypothetical protein
MAENKMEQVDFWIRYFKEHINTIGCVELDGLDCREVLALLQELADKKVDKPNKMEQIAKLFGKRLNQNFEIKHLKLHFRFTNAGLMFWEKETGCYLPAPHDVFMELLRGKREIKQGECGDCR